jgi:hypothetical protein
MRPAFSATTSIASEGLTLVFKAAHIRGEMLGEDDGFGHDCKLAAATLRLKRHPIGPFGSCRHSIMEMQYPAGDETGESSLVMQGTPDHFAAFFASRAISRQIFSST